MKVCMKHQGGSFIFWLDQYLKRFSIWKIAGRQSLIWWVFIYQNIDSIRVLTGFELFDPCSLHDNRNLTGSSIYLSNSGQLLTFDNQSDQEVQLSPLKTFFSGKLLIPTKNPGPRFKSCKLRLLNMFMSDFISSFLLFYHQLMFSVCIHPFTIPDW